MRKTYSTTIITDIRNFTGTFEKFQHQNSDDYLDYIEEYYKMQSDIANVISDKVHMGTTGDGVLTIFLGEENHIEGFAYLLALHKGLSKVGREFFDKTGETTDFAIGADSGHVWKIGKSTKKIGLNTYVGSVINRSARIENTTKLFGDTRVAVGYHLYNKLIEHFYPAAYSIMQEHVEKYDELLNNYPDVVLVSKGLMLFYIFEMELKHIEKPLPIFRLSESMAREDDNYWKVMSKLLSDKKVEKLKKIIE